MTFFDTRHQRAALLLALLGVGLTVAVAPYATGLIAAPVLYVVFEPLHRRMAREVGRRVSAVVVVLITVLVIVIPGLSVLGLVVDQAQSMASKVAAGPLLDRLSRLHVGRFDVGSEIASIGQQLVTFLGSNALRVVGTATRLVLNLLLAVFGLYYLMVQGNVWNAVRPYVPFSDEHAGTLRQRFKDVTTSTVIGTGLTALAQGLAVAASFMFTGLGDPLFWGVVTIVFAVLPVVGSGLVWGPAVAVLLFNDRLGAAAFMVIWNLGMTALIDYGIRPFVYDRFAKIHPMITLVGAIAGVGYFGLLGLLIGPLALSYFFEILRMYRGEYLPAGSGSGFTQELPVTPKPPQAGAPVADRDPVAD